MAHFRAVIQGGRGGASRLGTKRSGIKAVLQTWGHDLTVWVGHDDRTGRDIAEVRVQLHNGAGPSHVVATVDLTRGVVLS